MALLIEKYAGAFPTWLAPVQVQIIPVSEKHFDYSKKLEKIFMENNIRCEADYRNEKLGYKIRSAQLEKIPYMLIVGDKEAENNEVSVRSHKNGDIGTKSLDDFLSMILEEIKNKTL